MAKIRNVSGDNRTLSAAAGGRLVVKNGVIDIPDEDVYSYTQQSIWEPVDDAAKAAHDAGEEAYQERLAAEAGLPEPEVPPEVQQPAGNASRDEWAAYVVENGFATEEDIVDLGRDEIRDTYKQEG